MFQEQYIARYQDIKVFDARIWEITKISINRPFTVIIYNFSKSGNLPLFTDLFVCSEWDPERGENVSDDIKFLSHLWLSLGLEEDFGESFQPKHINLSCGRIPFVYRKPLETVLSQRFSFGF